MISQGRDALLTLEFDLTGPGKLGFQHIAKHLGSRSGFSAHIIRIQHDSGERYRTYRSTSAAALTLDSLGVPTEIACPAIGLA